MQDRGRGIFLMVLIYLIGIIKTNRMRYNGIYPGINLEQHNNGQCPVHYMTHYSEGMEMFYAITKAGKLRKAAPGGNIPVKIYSREKLDKKEWRALFVKLAAYDAFIEKEKIASDGVVLTGTGLVDPDWLGPPCLNGDAPYKKIYTLLDPELGAGSVDLYYTGKNAAIKKLDDGSGTDYDKYFAAVLNGVMFANGYVMAAMDTGFKVYVPEVEPETGKVKSGPKVMEIEIKPELKSEPIELKAVIVPSPLFAGRKAKQEATQTKLRVAAEQRMREEAAEQTAKRQAETDRGIEAARKAMEEKTKADLKAKAEQKARADLKVKEEADLKAKAEADLKAKEEAAAQEKLELKMIDACEKYIEESEKVIAAKAEAAKPAPAAVRKPAPKPVAKPVKRNIPKRAIPVIRAGKPGTKIVPQKNSGGRTGIPSLDRKRGLI